VIYSYNKSKRGALFLKFILVKNSLTVFGLNCTLMVLYCFAMCVRVRVYV
jgi:hypothetical protein